MSHCTKEKSDQLARGPLLVGFDGASTAGEVRSRWETELASWTAAYQNSLWHWCCSEQVFDGDVIDDPNKTGLTESYYFKKVGRDGTLLQEYDVLYDLLDSYQDLLLDVERFRFGVVSNTSCPEPYNVNPVFDDSRARVFRSTFTAAVQSDVEREFARWIASGDSAYSLNLYCFSACEYDYAYHTILRNEEIARDHVIKTIGADVSFDTQLILGHPKIERLRKNTLSRCVNRHLISKAVDRKYFDCIVQDCNNGWCVLLVREAYLAGVRLLTTSLLDHRFCIVSENDHLEFQKLEKSVLQCAQEAYAQDEHASLLGFNDADVFEWSTPVMTGERLPSYLAWRNIDTRLKEHSLIPREPVVELHNIPMQLSTNTFSVRKKRGEVTASVADDERVGAIDIRAESDVDPCPFDFVGAETPDSDVPAEQRSNRGSDEFLTARELQKKHSISQSKFAVFNKRLGDYARANERRKNVSWCELDRKDATAAKYAFLESSVMFIVADYANSDSIT
jgi:hypothetical protein